MIVRGLTAGDIPAAARIEAAAFTDPWPAASFTAFLGERHVVALAAEESRLLVGYAIGTAVADEGEILNLAVEPGVLRRGFGRALIDALLVRLQSRGARSFYLEVRESNAPALALYEAMGFRRMGRRKGYYREPREDAVTMIKTAPESAEK